MISQHRRHARPYGWQVPEPRWIRAIARRAPLFPARRCRPSLWRGRGPACASSQPSNADAHLRHHAAPGSASACLSDGCLRGLCCGWLSEALREPAPCGLVPQQICHAAYPRKGAGQQRPALRPLPLRASYAHLLRHGLWHARRALALRALWLRLPHGGGHAPGRAPARRPHAWPHLRPHGLSPLATPSGADPFPYRKYRQGGGTDPHRQSHRPMRCPHPAWAPQRACVWFPPRHSSCVRG